MSLKQTVVVLTFFLPCAIAILGEVRHRWFSDKRRSTYRLVSGFIIILMVAFLPVGFLATYLQFENPPKWAVVVNGLVLNPDVKEFVITIPTTNQTETLNIATANVGGATPERVNVALYVPTSLTNALEMGIGWQKQWVVSGRIKTSHSGSIQNQPLSVEGL